MKLNPTVLVACMVTMAVKTEAIPTWSVSAEPPQPWQPQPSQPQLWQPQLWQQFLPQNKPGPAVPKIGNALGTVGEIILGVGGGFLGAKKGIFDGATAGHALNHGLWDYGNSYPDPTYANGYVPANGQNYIAPNAQSYGTNGNDPSKPANVNGPNDATTYTEGSGNGCWMNNGLVYC